MRYRRMPIEAESPEQMGYDKIRNNLSESSFSDACLRDIDAVGDLKDLLLCYGSHQGHEGLRDLIAKDAGLPVPLVAGAQGQIADPPPPNTALTRDHVLLTIGAAGALFMIATTLLEKDDEIIVVRPNYATNIETPLAIGAVPRYIDLHFEQGFNLDTDKIRMALTPKTKYISVTYPHNPTGACLQDSQLKELVRIAAENNVRLLVDETYRDMTFRKRLPLAATCSPRVISVSSLSKTYGLPGLRVGWIVCRDEALMEDLLAAKEQIHICGPVIDEALAHRYFLQKEVHFVRIQKEIHTNFLQVKDWIEHEEEWEWVEPKGGCVCFPRLRDPKAVDIDKFYKILLEKYSTYVGPGHWFRMPRHYMRIGFGWPSAPQLEEGLEALSKAVREARIS